MNFKKWLKSVQTTGYNGARMVCIIVSKNDFLNGNQVWPTLFVKSGFCCKLKQRKNVTETFVKGTVLGLSRHDQLTIPLNKAPWPELSSR